MPTQSSQFIEITPRLSPRTAVFPGDRVFARKVAMSFEGGHALELSSIETTLHIGAHADAPSHYTARGQSIDERDPMLYIGPAQVIRVSLPRGARITVADLKGVRIEAPRVLFRTDSFPDPDSWNGDFNSLSPGLVEHLAANGVRLVGIDTPSVDPADDKVLESHAAIAAHDMAVLEGLVLDQVDPGTYFLIAPPLRLEGADASPVRALLVGADEWKKIAGSFAHG
ncbi:MAG: cyclase family protein [Oligoflexia bacterium]